MKNLKEIRKIRLWLGVDVQTQDKFYVSEWFDTFNNKTCGSEEDGIYYDIPEDHYIGKARSDEFHIYSNRGNNPHDIVARVNNGVAYPSLNGTKMEVSIDQEEIVLPRINIDNSY